MTFWQCYYHIVWATKNRAPLITASLEPILFHTIRHKSTELGCELLAVNAVNDHVHTAVRIPPSVAVKDWAKLVKGVSSREINTALGSTSERFRWQEGYGVLTFGARNIAFVTDYIVNQKTHHAQNQVQPYLERVE